MDEHIMDYSQISPNIYIGSDLCKGGICPIHSEEFKKLGVKVEINLSIERKEFPPDDMVGYVWIPVIDGDSPTREQFELGSSVINWAVENNNIIYVHCKNGHSRSPSLVVAYLIRFKGYNVENAIEFVKQKRGEIHIEESQMKGLAEFQKKWLK